MREICLSRQVPVKKIGVGKEEKRVEDGSDVSVSLNSDDTSDETTISSDSRKAKAATKRRFGNLSDNSDESDKISGESKEDDSEKISEEGKEDKSEKKSEEGKEDKEEESDDKSGNSSDGPSDGDESEEESNVKSDDDKSGNSSEGDESEEEDKHNEGKDKTDYVEEEEEEEEEEDKFEDGEYFQQEAIPPKMYFQPSEYNSPIKLSGRCYIEKAVRKLKEILNPSELKWFETHPQFRHFFHMYLEDNHKAMGMWMLLLHTVSSSKKKECWFVVNGVPIRYSLREVALISGLNCQSYPHNYLSLGGDSAKFVEKNFGKGNKGGSGKPKKVTLKDVDEKLESMKGKYCKSRLNIDVLYFLANVIVGKSKTGTGAPGVEPFFLRAASDLNLCETFPWGRFAFDENMKDIIRVVEKYHPTVPGAVNVVFPSFILPLEFLAFEAIKVLGSHFRVPCEGADSRCPRMCKTKFKRGDMKGFALSEINAILGDTKDIESVLVPSNAEKEMLDELMDTVDLEYDAEDLIVDGWKSIVLDQKRDIFFEEMYEEDVRSRKSEEKKGEKKPVDQVVQNEPEKLI